jgi:hypothetical protein
MAAAFELIAVGAAFIVAGSLLAVNAKKIAASDEREFYGPVTPTEEERKRDRWMTDALGINIVRWKIFGAALIALGMILDVAGINLAVHRG